ncbi:hypothetical protein FD754_009974 [Muntiacus muntjak]|uniref:RanBP2-type domain-containing protein n=1 Tax=Muntiacus muntjak TaxID=9888 RepID=A0A5N3WY66_MUNMU|nr:hypothetical protein FD754_009974 [Muntiacus muntjak]
MEFLNKLYYIILILKKRLWPPAGGWAAGSDPGSATVLVAVHAAVRPLGAGLDVEAQLRRLQLSADPERPGRFRLEMLGAGPGAVDWRPGTLSLHFANPQEAQRWAALVQDATMAGQNVSTPKVPQPKADHPWSPGDLLEKEELAGCLTRAVEGGDEKGAAQAAAILAQHRVALRAQPQEACFPPGPIRLQVTGEDAASSAHVSLQVFSELDFPPAVRRWVIGRCLCVPEHTLASYGIRRNGDPAFLYLPQRPQKVDGKLGGLFSQSLGLPPTPQPPGWPCPSCTFNDPGHPGCEMCSTQRPCAWEEDGPSLPGPRSLDPLLNLSGNLC